MNRYTTARRTTQTAETTARRFQVRMPVRMARERMM
jgi:hypothetical protein